MTFVTYFLQAYTYPLGLKISNESNDVDSDIIIFVKRLWWI